MPPPPAFLFATELRESRTMKDTLQFILAGNALFTVENAETGNRFTFKVRKPDDDKPSFLHGPVRGVRSDD